VVEVRKDRGVVLAVGCPHKAPAGLDAKSGQPPDASYSLVINEKSVTTEFVCHLPVVMAGRLILDVFDDRSQLGVSQPFGFGGRAITVSAAGRVHGFAPPQDGAGAGPLVTDDLSLPFRIGIGLFSGKIQLHLELTDLAFRRGDAASASSLLSSPLSNCLSQSWMRLAEMS
jgi:hypothetical protein